MTEKDLGLMWMMMFSGLSLRLQFQCLPHCEHAVRVLEGANLRQNNSALSRVHILHTCPLFEGIRSALAIALALAFGVRRLAFDKNMMCPTMIFCRRAREKSPP